MVVERVLIQAELGRFGRRWILLSVVQFWLLAGGTASAQTQLDRFFPPAVASGEPSTVIAEGKFPTWPVSIESSRGDVQISAAKDSGKLEVTVAENASPGVTWVRLFDSKSASQLVPLLVAPVAVTQEKEPNDKREDANSLDLPAVVAGRLQKGGDSDGYRIRASGGRPLVVSATANEVLRSPMDAVLQITDVRGNVLAQSDDRRGLDPQLVFTPDTDRELLIRIFAFPSTPNSTVGFGGSAAFVYTLDVTQGAFLDHAVVTGSEVLPFGDNLDESAAVHVRDADQVSASTASMKGALGWCFLPQESTAGSRYYREPFETALPTVVLGHIRSPKETHTVTFAAKAGTKYRAEAQSKVDGFLLDSKLDAIDAKSGTVLASNDDVSRGGYDAAIEFTTKFDGNVDVKLTEMLEAFGPRHFYRLSIRPVAPTFNLTLTNDRFVLTGDKPLEIPVAIKREFGFAGRIQVEINGLPAGVTCKPVVSESKGETAKAIKLKLEPGDAQAGHSTIRVTGRELDAEGNPSDEATAATFSLRPSIDIEALWLTVAENEKAKDK